MSTHLADIELLVNRLKLEEQAHLRLPTKASAKRVRALSLELKKAAGLQRSSTVAVRTKKVKVEPAAAAAVEEILAAELETVPELAQPALVRQTTRAPRARKVKA